MLSKHVKHLRMLTRADSPEDRPDDHKYFLQGLPVLVGLVEDNMQDNSSLTQIGVQCIWRVLEVHGAGPLNHLCRLLSNAGLPHRLMRAMLSLNQEYQILLKQAEVRTAAQMYSATTAWI